MGTLRAMLPLAGGFLSQIGEGLGFLVACMHVSIVAYRLRSWWTLLIMPIPFALGLAVGLSCFLFCKGGGLPCKLASQNMLNRWIGS